MATARILAFQPDTPKTEASGNENSLKSNIDRYLGKPYVWGSSGLKSFDCSGFVWRVLNDSGIYLKRTTARKLYLALPKPSANSAWNFGNIVFFDDLKHCGIVCNRDTFYHAQSSIGTNLSRFNPYWQKKIVDVRQLPAK
jgi:peptidoglycan endopeptidase LytE